jgi:hypothetical protein
MPKIPSAGQPNLVSMDVQRTPTESIDQAGMVGRAKAGLAQTAGQIAGEFGAKLAQAEAKAKALEIRSNYAVEADSIRRELEVEYDGDPEGFALEYESRTNRMKGVLFRDVKNPVQREAAENALVDLEFNGKRGAHTYERNRRVQKAYGTLAGAVNSQAQKLTVAFDPLESVRENAKLKESFTTSPELFTPEEVDKAHNEIDNKMFDSMVNYYANNPELAKNGLDILEGRHTQSENLIDNIDSNKIGRAIAKLKSASNVNSGIRRATIAGDMRNIRAAIAGFNDVGEQAFIDLEGKIMASGFDESPEMLDNVATMRQMNEGVQKYMDLSADDKRRAIDDELKLTKAPAHFNAAARANFQQDFKNTIMNLSKAMEKNGGDFALSRRSGLEGLEKRAMDFDSETVIQDMQEYVKTTKVVQDELGIQNTMLPTTTMKANYAAAIKNPNGRAGATAVEAITEGFGEDAGMLIKNMVESEALEPEYATAFYVEEFDSKEVILGNIANKQEINKVFKDKKSTVDNDENDLMNHESVRAMARSINLSNPEGTNSKLVSGFQDAIKTEYRRLIGMEEVAHDVAKERAVSIVLDKNFAFTENDYQMMIPKKLKVEPDTVEDFANTTRYNMDVFADKVDIQPPKDFPGDRKNYINHLKSTSHWVWDGNDGAQLYEFTSSNKPSLVTDGEGNPIKLKYEQMNDAFFDQKELLPKFKRITGTGIKF